MRRTPRLHTKPRRALPLSLADAIEARVAAMLPQHQEKAEAAILTMLRDEFGMELEIRGEATVKRATGMVRGWRMG